MNRIQEQLHSTSGISNNVQWGACSNSNPVIASDQRIFGNFIIGLKGNKIVSQRTHFSKSIPDCGVGSQCEAKCDHGTTVVVWAKVRCQKGICRIFFEKNYSVIRKTSILRWNNQCHLWIESHSTRDKLESFPQIFSRYRNFSIQHGENDRELYSPCS
jgi:hypothetical protein